jgi:hypothetical protein
MITEPVVCSSMLWSCKLLASDPQHAFLSSIGLAHALRSRVRQPNNNLTKSTKGLPFLVFVVISHLVISAPNRIWRQHSGAGSPGRSLAETPIYISAGPESRKGLDTLCRKGGVFGWQCRVQSPKMMMPFIFSCRKKK